jgi:hypothetical protein
MQDFAPFIPNILGALSQTPGHKGRQPSASICLLLFNFLLLLQNLLTSLNNNNNVVLAMTILA